MPALAACASQTAPDRLEVAAVLVQPGPAARAELRSAVAGMLDVPDVTLADDVLLHDSRLIIEKVHPRDARGLQLSGRDYDKPVQFRLVKSGEYCILLLPKTGKWLVLHHAVCAAEQN
jgi:hypothetical protein